MRVALLADIHGNTLALDAVLSDLETVEVDTRILMGDYFLRNVWDIARQCHVPQTIAGVEVECPGDPERLRRLQLRDSGDSSAPNAGDSA